MYAALNAQGIAYERFAHEAAMTMRDCEAYDQGRAAAHCKNLFLTNRQGTQFYILLIVGDKSFKTKYISKQLNVSRLSFATAEQLHEKLKLSPGAVTPMGLIHDVSREITLLIDRDITAWEEIIVHPNVNTASIILKTKALLEFLRTLGYSARYVDIEEQAETEERKEA